MEPEEEFEEKDLTEEEYKKEIVELNKHGRPKQPVIFFELTEQHRHEAQEEIDRDVKCMTEEQYQKITNDAAKTWDKFYRNHKCNFFKDRKYLEKEIPELGMLR